MHIIVKYGFFYHLLSNDAQELKGHVEILSSLVDESKAYTAAKLYRTAFVRFNAQRYFYRCIVFAASGWQREQGERNFIEHVPARDG